MTQRPVIIRAAMLLASLLWSATAVADMGATCAGGVIVRLINGADIADFGPAIEAMVVDRIEDEPIWLLDADLHDLIGLGGSGLVEAIAPNSRIRGTSGGFFVDAIDGDYTDQYALDRINVPTNPLGGMSTIVAVLDTGVDTSHPELAPIVLSSGYDFVDDDNDPFDTGNGIDDNNNGVADELVGHGTFVTGLIHLTAPAARIHPVRVLNSDGAGCVFNGIAGIYHAINRRVDVINLSFVVEGDNAVFAQAVIDARGAAITVVAAAGNNNVITPIYPAAYGHTVAVAATDAMDKKAPFSNYGEHIALCAPGRKIVSTVPGGYGMSNGTSFAAAFVAGAAAQVIRAHPFASPGMVEDILRDSAENIDDVNVPYAGLLGSGRIDVGRAIHAN